MRVVHTAKSAIDGPIDRFWTAFSLPGGRLLRRATRTDELGERRLHGVFFVAVPRTDGGEDFATMAEINGSIASRTDAGT